MAPMLNRTVPQSRRPVLILAAFIGAALSSCSVSVSTFSINDGAYKAMWSRDWTAINGDAQAFAPSTTGPGACNTGSTKLACYATSLKVADDLQTLVSDLKTASTPAQYATASATLSHTAQLDITGLRLRAQSLTVAESKLPQDNAMFSQGRADIQQASGGFAQAYGEFPSYDVPLPVPFPAGYSG